VAWHLVRQVRWAVRPGSARRGHRARARVRPRCLTGLRGREM